MNANLGYISYDDYAALEGIRWSTLRAMNTSPLAYRHAVSDSPTPVQSDLMALGCCIHSATFEPETLVDRYAPWSGRRAGNDWKTHCLISAGKQVIRRSDYDKARELAAVLRAHPLVAPYLKDAACEQSYIWTDPDTGLKCKTRIDCVSTNRPLIVELKSTHNIEECAFGRLAGRMLYHGQLAFQTMGYCAVNSTPLEGRSTPFVTDLVPDVRIIAVQTRGAPDVAVFRIPEEELIKGEQLAQRLLGQVKACQEADSWPGRYAEERMLPIQTWDDDEDDSLTIDGEEFRI